MADTPSNPYGSPEDKPHTPHTPPVPPSTPPSTSGGAVPPPPPSNPYAQPVPLPGPKDNTQLYGILGIVLGVLCCAPIGALFGWLSMNEAKKSGKDDTLGKVAFWLGIALTALAVIGTLIACLLGAFSGSMNYDR